MNYDLKTLSRRLKQRRDEMGMTLADVADEIGYVTSTVHTWETGQRQPRADGLFWLAKTLDVSADWLLGLSDKKEI